jgi:hypothetical protein
VIDNLVGAIGFEPTTPCAQGGFRLTSKSAYFYPIEVEWVAEALFK